MFQMVAELTAAHHHDHCSEEKCFLLNWSCGTILHSNQRGQDRSSTQTVPPIVKTIWRSKKRREKIQSKSDKMTLRSFEKAFFFLVNWLTKLLLWPNTSAPGLFKKNPMNLKKPILCQHCQQWCFAARHCGGLQSWGALATVLYVCFFHPFFFSNKSGSTFRFRASKEVLLCLLSLRYHNIALRRWPSPDVFACVFGR